MKENLDLNLESTHKYQIEGSNVEFEYNFTHARKNIFECNYKLDENCLPSHYILLSREKVVSNIKEILQSFKEFLKKNNLVNNVEEITLDNEFLIRGVEVRLRDMLRESAHLSYLSGDMNKSDRDKYFEIKSDCESHVNAGILELSQKEASERTLVFLRNFSQRPQSLSSSWSIETNSDIDSIESSHLLTQLKNRITHHLSSNNIETFDSIKVKDDGTVDMDNYLENVGKKIQEKVISLFSKINKNQQTSMMYEKEQNWKRMVYQDHIENYSLRKRLCEKFLPRGEDDIAVEKVETLIYYLKF